MLEKFQKEKREEKEGKKRGERGKERKEREGKKESGRSCAPSCDARDDLVCVVVEKFVCLLPCGSITILSHPLFLLNKCTPPL